MIERIRVFFRSSKGIRVTVLLGIAGMLLILFSGMMPDGEKKQPEAGGIGAESINADAYRTAMEARLTELLSGMDGVGAVQVMVTLNGSAEQIYAEEVRVSKGDHNEQKQSEYVITRSGGNESALLSRTAYPDVQGAAVLCAGGGHASVREKVQRAAATLLGIPVSRVFVGKTVSN